MSGDSFRALFGRGRINRFSVEGGFGLPQQSQPAGHDIIEGSGFIADGSVYDGSFASTIDPVLLRTTATLTAADAIANPNRVAFNTDNAKLYRSNGATWTTLIATTDLSGQVTSTQITDLAISTPKLAANAVTAAKIAANTITAAEIAADTITAGEIAAGAISTSELAALAVTAGKIAANTITASEIAADAITASELAADAVTATKIAVGQIDPTHLSGDNKNLVPNPGGEAATVSGQTTLQGWTLTNTGIRTGSLMRSGNAVFQAIAPSAAGYNAAVSGFLPAQGSRRYRARVWLSGFALNAATAQGTLQLTWYDQSKSIISSSTIGTLTKGTNSAFSEIAGTAVAPATAVWVRVLAIASGTVVTGDRLYWDDFELSVADQDVNHASGTVVIDSTGITVTNGALTVTNAGSTVIIDGSSNMFKIFATGTINRAFPSVATGYAETDVAISASGGTPRPVLWHMAIDNSAVNNDRYGGYAHVLIAEHTAARAYGISDAVGNCHARLACESILVNPGVTATVRYYMLVEAGF